LGAFCIGGVWVTRRAMSDAPRGRAAVSGSHKRNRYLTVFLYSYTAFTLGLPAVVLIPQGQDASAQSNSAFVLVWVVMQAIALGFLLTERRNNGDLAIAIAIGLFLVASAVWSVSPT